MAPAHRVGLTKASWPSNSVPSLGRNRPGEGILLMLFGSEVGDEEAFGGGVEGIVDMGETPMLHAMILAMILFLGGFKTQRPMYSLLQQYPPCRMGQG